MVDVVVTGRGIVTSLGETPDAFFDALLHGASGIADGVGACTDFDPEPAMTAKEARRADRFTQFGVKAAMAAAAEAGVPEAADPARTGVILGTGVGGLETLERECRAWIEGGDRAVSPHFVPMMMPNAAAGTVAMKLGIHGPGFSIASACATGSHAIGEAKRMIERGEADVVLAGGAEAALTGLCMAAFNAWAQCRARGCPARSTCGATASSWARERRCWCWSAPSTRPRAEPRCTRGSPATAPRTTPSTSPSRPRTAAERQTRCARRSRMPARRPSTPDISTPTARARPFNDRIETQAVHAVFNGGAPPVSSTKSNIGHLLGAAGAVEALTCVEALRRGVLPATINLEQPDPECDLDHVRARRARRTTSSSR